MDLKLEDMVGNTAETGAIGVEVWSDGSIYVSAHTLKGSAMAELSLLQAQQLIDMLSKAVEAANAN